MSANSGGKAGNDGYAALCPSFNCRPAGSAPAIAALLLAALLSGWIALLGGGCAHLPASEQAMNLYILDADLTGVTRTVTESGAVVAVVTPVRAVPPYDTARMAYIREPERLEFFANNRWADAPASMLRPLLVKGLERSGAFRAVVAAASGGTDEVRIDTQLMQLRQEFMTTESLLRLTLRVQLFTGDGQVLATRTFEETEPAPGNDPAAGARAANRLLGRLLPEVAAYCARVAAGT